MDHGLVSIVLALAVLGFAVSIACIATGTVGMGVAGLVFFPAAALYDRRLDRPPPSSGGDEAGDPVLPSAPSRGPRPGAASLPLPRPIEDG